MGRPKVSKGETVVITFKDSEKTANALNDKAKEVGRTRSGLLRRLVKKFLGDI